MWGEVQPVLELAFCGVTANIGNTMKDTVPHRTPTRPRPRRIPANELKVLAEEFGAKRRSKRWNASEFLRQLRGT